MMTDTPLTDLTYLEDFSDNDREFVREMIETFLKKSGNDLQRITDALAASDWQQLYEAVHKIKPSITFMGIHALKDDVVVLEQYAQQRAHLDEVPALVERTVNVCRRAIVELEALLPRYA